MGAVLPYDTLVSRLEDLQFYVLSPHEILARSVVEVNKTDTYVAATPVDNGLFDLRMGTLNNCHSCRTCGQRMNACVGHFGHIELVQPVFYAQFFSYIKKLMKVVCHRCSCLYVGDTTVLETLCKLSRSKRLDAAVKATAKIKKCPGCEGRKPDRVMKEPVIRLVMTWKASRHEEEMKVTLSAAHVISVLAKVSAQHCEALGFSSTNRPEWLICSVLPCPPPCMRPSARNEAGQRAEDDITHKLIDVLKANNVLKQRMQKDVPLDQMESSVQLLQYHVATLVDNQMNGVNPSAQRNGRVITSVSERLKAKNGRIRGSLMGKRVDFSARTVITADPNICVDELGVPLRIAMNLTFPEVVNRHNMETLSRMVSNGPDVYPGAKFVRKGRRIIMIKNARKVPVVLEEGDVVDRHLLDGDYVIFNRQPSLHRCSMMAHAIRVLPFDTFRLNVCVTPPYNADFDGDEANIHIPQSLQTMIELGLLSSVPHHVISPRDSKPIVSIVQDVALGVYRMTLPDASMTAEEVCNTVSRLSILTNPKIRKWFEGITSWKNHTVHGRDELSMLLPECIRFRGPNRFYDEMADDPQLDYVIIDDGNIRQGVVDKTIFQSRTKGILHSTYNSCGPMRACSLLDDTQKMVCDWLVVNGASVGLSDFIVDGHTKHQLDDIIHAMKVKVYDIIRQSHLSTNKTNITQEEYEKEINNVLNHTVSKAGKIGLSTINSSNRMIQMVKSGSKGNVINVSQIVACVGQQNVDGRRIDNGFDGRTLPHFNKYDVGPKARGFVENSFLRGLDPQEFFFHAMAGREGLIHTAVNTSETGYIQRKLVKAMEDCKASNDGSVRDANGSIVSFAYGDDGYDATRLEVQHIFFLSMNEKELHEAFFLPGLEDHVSRIVSDRNMLVGNDKGVFHHDKEYITMQPVDITRLLNRHACRANRPEANDSIAPMLLKEVEDAIADMPNDMMGVLMRTYLSPKRLMHMYGICTLESLSALLRDIKHIYEDGMVQANEMVGIVAAQSIGEPSSQCTLNTFHFSGVASASQVVRGVPRLKELLSVAKSIKSPCMTVHMVPAFSEDKVKAHSVANELRSLHLCDVYVKSEVFFDPGDDITTIYKDACYIKRDAWCDAAIAEVDVDVVADTKTVPWILRVELDREKMDMYEVTMLDVAVCLEKYHGDKIHLYFTDDCDDDLFFRMRPLPHIVSESMTVMETMLVMQAMQKSVLDNVCLKGVPGVNNIHMSMQHSRRHVPLDEGGVLNVDKWVLYTQGSSLSRLLAHPHVDALRTISNDVSEVYAVLGIEAARAVLVAEIQGIMKDADVTVDDRHVALLADVMTCRGALTSIDRHGMNRGDAGFLSKCSFEETVDVLVKAAVFTDVEHMNSVSSNVIFGQVPTAGTGIGKVSYDTTALRDFEDDTTRPTTHQLSTLFTTTFS